MFNPKYIVHHNHISHYLDSKTPSLTLQSHMHTSVHMYTWMHDFNKLCLMINQAESNIIARRVCSSLAAAPASNILSDDVSCLVPCKLCYNIVHQSNVGRTP